VYELGDRFGIERRTVSNNPPPTRRAVVPPWPLARPVDDAIRLYNLGWSLARVGNHLGVDHTAVLDQLRERGTPMRDAHGRLGRDVPTILRCTVKRRPFESIPTRSLL
jgi:hypothetical protein